MLGFIRLFLETVILTNVPRLCWVPGSPITLGLPELAVDLVRGERWWCVVVSCGNCHRWQWYSRGDRGARLLPLSFQNPALYRRGEKKLQQGHLEQKITDNVNTEERSRRLGVTTVLGRAETEEDHGDAVGSGS